VVASLFLADERGSVHDVGSSWRSDDRGARALFLLLEETGHHPRRLDLPLPPPRSLLLSIEPARTERDRELLAWVAEGGVLVFAARAPEPNRGAARVPDLAPTLGLTLVDASVPAAPPDDSPWRGLIVEASPRHFRPISRGRVLLGSAATPVALEIPLGQGRIVALANPSWLENAGLERGQALELALRALVEPRLPIFFDEARHGLGEQPGLGYVLARYGLLPTAFAALLLLALLVWRTTPAEATLAPSASARGEIRDSLVEARAGLYTRSLPSAAALGMLERDLQAGLSAGLGAAQPLGWDALAQRLEKRRPGRGQQLAELRREIARSAAAPPADLQSLVPLARRAASFVKELR
jgi:hypothetical protein